MYFPVSGVEVNPLIPVLVSFAISFLASTGGLSGAFLLLPFQVSVLKFTSPAVSATNHLFNMIAIPGGVYRFIKEGRMVWPITFMIILGTLPGVFIGAIVRLEYLPDPASFKFFAGLVLLYIGIKLLLEILTRKENSNHKKAEEKFRKHIKELGASSSTQQLKVDVKEFTVLKIVFDFAGENFKINNLWLTALSFVVGIIGGIYGIGGGAIIVPFLVSFFRLPIYTVSGAALMGTFTTSVAAVIFYQILSNFYTGVSVAPDWLLGLLFGLGGAAGVYLGAVTQKYFHARVIKYILVTFLMFTAVNYIIEFITK